MLTTEQYKVAWDKRDTMARGTTAEKKHSDSVRVNNGHRPFYQPTVLGRSPVIWLNQ